MRYCDLSHFYLFRCGSRRTRSLILRAVVWILEGQHCGEHDLSHLFVGSGFRPCGFWSGGGNVRSVDQNVGSTSGWGWIAIHRRYRLRVVFNQIELGGMVETTELPQPEPLFILHVLRRGIWLETESSKVRIGLNPKVTQLYRSSLYGSTKHLRACPMDIRSFGNRGPIHHGPIRRPSFGGLLLVSSRSTLVTIYKL